MALRTQLEAGVIDTAQVQRRLAEWARVLLVRHTRDAELKHVAKGLAARGFVPAAPATLPRGTAAEVRHALLRRSPAELAALASALVVVPDVVADTAGAIAALELFVLVPSEAARAEALAAALEGRGHDVSLARFELALRGLDARKPETFVAALNDVSEAQRSAARQRAAAVALAAAPKRHGSEWLVPVRDGAAVANAAEAFARRPALRSELGVIAEWIEAASPGPDDHARVADALAQVQASGPFAAVATVPAPQPTSALAARLKTLAQGVGARDAVDASALELLGDRRAAARLWLELGRSDLPALVHATRLVGELGAKERRELVGLVRNDAVLDETRYDEDTRVRAELLLQLEPDAWLPIRLYSKYPAAKAVVAPQGEAAVAESDPHHPDNRLAAASDLLAAGKLEPASNILAALVRKADEVGEGPARLFTVVARALEADEPPADLLHAVQRALSDGRRQPLFLALAKAPSAAFALHEDLLSFALDPSRSDVDRLAALEVWLGIWRASETAPDPDAIRTLRDSEPALLVAAALRLGGQADPLAALGRFLDAKHAPDAFSDALLAASLGR